MKVIADLCIVPLGVGLSLSKYIAACERILSQSGLKPRLHAYGTNVEGEWEWVSFDPAEGAGLLGDLGLENGLPYVMKVEEEGVCNYWEMPH